MIFRPSKGAGTITGPEGEEISFKSLEIISLAEEPATPPVGEDGLVHDGKLTVTIGGEAYKGDPAYAIVVDGKEVARGEVDWAKETEGAEKLYGNEDEWDVDNSQVLWKDISVDYDFTGGMPQKVEVRFLNDACGGHDPESGEWQDRNLIVDKIKVDGLTVQSEGDFTKYPQSVGKYDLDGGGMERMPWQGTLEFNINDAYSSHLENYNQSDDRVKVEPVEIFSTSFEMTLEEGEKSNPSYKFSEAEGWSTASESIEVWSDEMIRDLGVQPSAKTGASDGHQFIELNDVPSNVYADAGNIFREVPTEKGKVYKLSFDASGRPGYDASVNSFEVSVGGKQLGFYNYDMTEKKDHDWQQNSVEFYRDWRKNAHRIC